MNIIYTYRFVHLPFSSVFNNLLCLASLFPNSGNVSRHNNCSECGQIGLAGMTASDNVEHLEELNEAIIKSV